MDAAATQLGFTFDGPLPQNEAAETVSGATIEERFHSFHQLNPHVYLAITSLARELKRQGWAKAGMKQIFEQLRWKFAVATRGDRWRLNNDFTAPYARLVMKQERDLDGFFETREAKGTT